MKMKRCLGAGVLLMLSPEAALLVAVDVSTIIRLHSDTHEDKLVMAVAAARPWACCDVAACTKSIPTICHCVDEVDQCAATCKSCEASTSDPSRYVCNDQYASDPGPICRPWDCCDVTGCTPSMPPLCHCRDKVDRCAPTCYHCAPAFPPTDPPRRVCNDWYHGDPGPKCNVDRQRPALLS